MVFDPKVSFVGRFSRARASILLPTPFDGSILGASAKAGPAFSSKTAAHLTFEGDAAHTQTCTFSFFSDCLCQLSQPISSEALPSRELGLRCIDPLLTYLATRLPLPVASACRPLKFFLPSSYSLVLCLSDKSLLPSTFFRRLCDPEHSL